MTVRGQEDFDIEERKAALVHVTLSARGQSACTCARCYTRDMDAGMSVEWASELWKPELVGIRLAYDARGLVADHWAILNQIIRQTMH